MACSTPQYLIKGTSLSSIWVTMVGRTTYGRLTLTEIQIGCVSRVVTLSVDPQDVFSNC